MSLFPIQLVPTHWFILYLLVQLCASLIFEDACCSVLEARTSPVYQALQPCRSAGKYVTLVKDRQIYLVEISNVTQSIIKANLFNLSLASKRTITN